jgi:hypothetical protein
MYRRILRLWSGRLFRRSLKVLLSSDQVDHNMVNEVSYFVKILDLNCGIPYPCVSLFTNVIELYWSSERGHLFVYIFYDGSVNIFYRGLRNREYDLEIRTDININNFGIHNFGSTYDETKIRLDYIFKRTKI